MSAKQTDFFVSLIEAARENPLSAALIGGGALWLLIGDDKLKGAARSVVTAASEAVESGTSNLRATAARVQRTAAPPTAPEMDQGSGVGESPGARSRDATGALSTASESVREGFSGSAAFARQQFGKLGDAIPAGETFAQARSSLGDMLKRQPLALGAVGLAIGAAIAGTFRTFDIESEYVGEISDDLKDELSRRGRAVSKALREASDTVMAEAGDTGMEAADRLKQAGTDAAQAALNRVKLK